MKILKSINMFLLTVIVYCLSANGAFASEDPLAIITFNSTGQEFRTEELKYYPQQQIWSFVAEGSTQEQLVRAKDVCINSPAGILCAEDNGALYINTGDGYLPVTLEYSDFQWTIRAADSQVADEPLAVVKMINSKKTFKCEIEMRFDVQAQLWSFNCEEGDVATRHCNPHEILLTTPAGEMVMFRNSLWLYWTDWRKDRLPMSITPNTDGSWTIRHGKIN